MNIDQPGKSRFIKTVRSNLISALKKTPSTERPGSFMTQSELARLLLITPQQLFKILNEGNPTLGTIWQICNTLSISPQSLFEGTELEDMNRIDPNDEQILKDREKNN